MTAAACTGQAAIVTSQHSASSQFAAAEHTCTQGGYYLCKHVIMVTCSAAGSETACEHAHSEPAERSSNWQVWPEIVMPLKTWVGTVLGGLRTAAFSS